MKDRLIQAALAARKNAYARYSRFQVGAALLTREGKIYSGCNIENASYGAANCAERTAIFKAVSEGEREFSAIAIAGGTDAEPTDFCYPCGICRQVLAEFCSPDLRVYIVKSEKEYKELTLGELLPYSFGGDILS